MYGGCEKVQDWSGDLTSNESGVWLQERADGERDTHSEKKREREREREIAHVLYKECCIKMNHHENKNTKAFIHNITESPLNYILMKYLSNCIGFFLICWGNPAKTSRVPHHKCGSVFCFLIIPVNSYLWE